MTNIDAVVERCAEVVSKWQQRNPTIELAQDFAAVFGFELNWTLTPKDVEPVEAKAMPEQAPQQYGLFSDFTVEDKTVLKSWRDNNGL